MEPTTTIWTAVAFTLAFSGGNTSPISSVEMWKVDSKTAAIASCELQKPDRAAYAKELGLKIVLDRCFYTHKKVSTKWVDPDTIEGSEADDNLGDAK